MERGGLGESTLLRRLNVFLVLSLAGCCVIILLASYFWVFALFTHLVPQAALAAFVLLGVSLFLRQKQMAILSGLMLFMTSVTILIATYHLLPEKAGKNAQKLTIVSANVLSMNTHYEDVVSLVEKENPDIFIAIEVNSFWAAALDQLKPFYPYAHVVAREDNFGLAIYSKRPFMPKYSRIGDFEIPLLEAQFDGFRVFAVHPLPPMGWDQHLDMKNYFDAVMAEAGRDNLPAVLAGDFNMTVWSQDNIRPFIKSGFKTANPHLIAWTWPSDFFPFAMQIDHVFIKGMTAVDFSTLPDIGSDHFPVRATIALTSSSQP